eukprot:COSAG02_NODE_38514_length_428_cov_0.784195_1_plen_125_part_10
MHAGERGCFPDIEPIAACLLPWESKSGTLAAAYSEAHFTSVIFGHFQRSDCGKSSVAITTHPQGGDVTFPHLFRGTRWLSSVDLNARFDFDSTAARDGFQHLGLIDVDGSLTGTVRSYDAPSVAG